MDIDSSGINGTIYNIYAGILDSELKSAINC